MMCGCVCGCMEASGIFCEFCKPNKPSSPPPSGEEEGPPNGEKEPHKETDELRPPTKKKKSHIDFFLDFPGGILRAPNLVPPPPSVGPISWVGVCKGRWGVIVETTLWDRIN